jgi:energy-coupling factor transport system substrate-specific component
LARGRAVETSSDASRLQNAPFSAETEATLLTRATPDPVWPVLLTLVLVAAIAGLRAVRRAGLRSAAIALNPRTVVRKLSRPVAGLRKAPTRHPQAANAGPRASVGAAHSGLLSLAIYGLTAGIGLLALLQPFLSAALGTPANGANASNAPLLVTILMALCFLALLFEIQGQAVSAKMIALLGVLVAINSVLRFVEVSIPGPGGFTPVFFLIVLTGYVFGGRFGFLMGALTMLVSSLITGGVGPWLPGQMFTAGWMGLIAPLARPLVRLLGGRPNSRTEIVVLAGYAGLCGLFYGVVINLWFWPFMTGPADQYWQAGVSFAETVQRYALYYTATSLLWDVFAVAGNLFLVAVFGAATLRALRRFHQRFEFEYRPVGMPIEPNPADELPDKPATPVAKTGLPRPAMSLGEG